jgi:6-phosphogluconolactonase
VPTYPPDSAPASFEIRVLPNAAALAEAGAREFARAASDAIDDRGIFRVVLAGGSTPRTLYGRLTGAPYRRSVRWNGVRFFFGDERCVPPDHERSNYRMARETLLEPLKIPPRHVLRMKGEEEPARAARACEEAIRHRFSGRPARFDLVLLGLAEDGHTASLFPGTEALAERRRLVAANYVPKFSEWRLTLTFRALNAARRVIFLVSGPEKAAAAAKILKERRGYRDLPASAVSPRRGTLLWLLDEAAASPALRPWPPWTGR